jgi:SAM-dependent methyltransferase
VTPGADGQTEAYSRSAARWAAGPDRVYYRPLGAALVGVLAGALAEPLAGRRVLDLGAGTGAVTAELVAAGAHVVALDRAPGMLAFRRAERPPAAVADAVALPVRAGTVAAVAAGCCLAHLSAPGVAVAEAATVLAPGGVVAASAFPTVWRDPLKAIVEAALLDGGWQPPPWYEALKAEGESATGAPGPFRALAVDAGLAGDVVELVVPIEFADATAVVDWRLGMAQTAPWVDGLEPHARDGLRAIAAAAVRAAVGDGPVRLEVPLLVLVARRS